MARREILGAEPEPQLRASAPLEVSAVVVRRLRLELQEPFETSFGRLSTRLIVLVEVEAEGLTGWGEVVAAERPLFSYETVETAGHVLRDFFAARDPGRCLSPVWTISRGGSRRFAAIRWPAPASSSRSPT
jgi:O-succinylbenzoate synthase